MFVQPSFKHNNKLSYLLAKKVAATQLLRSVLEQLVKVSCKLSGFRATEEFLRVDALKTV